MIPEIYRKLGVRPVIHGSGTTTRYGGSLLRPEALEAMREASLALVNIDELNAAALRREGAPGRALWRLIMFGQEINVP